MSEVREWTTATETAEIAALKARIVRLEHERDALRPLAAAALAYTDAYEAARTAYLAAMRAGESPMNHSEDSATWTAWEHAIEARERALVALREVARGMRND